VRGRPPLSPQLLLHLQTTAGNQAVLRLLATSGEPPAVKETSKVQARTSVPVQQLPLSLWQRVRRGVRWGRAPAPIPDPPRLLGAP
jgi:hypothetical protein